MRPRDPRALIFHHRGDPLWRRPQQSRRRNAFGATSTTDEVLEGVNLARQARAGDRRLGGPRRGDGPRARGSWRRGRRRGARSRQGEGRDRKVAPSRKTNGLTLVELDLASLASVRAAADGLVADGRRFDLVICNAGVMATPFGKTADGFETQFGTNHLGHFTFVNRIASLMRPGARLVNLSSAGHQMSDVDLDDPNFERTPYDPWAAYGRSKTANILFAVEFDRRHRERRNSRRRGPSRRHSDRAQPSPRR